VSLSGDGNTAIVGGAKDNGGVGAAWVWTRSGGVWTQQGTKLVGSGAAVALSADGNTAIVGGANDNGGVGAAWVFAASAPAVPVITAQPQGQTAQAGNNVTFIIIASGMAPLNYQWRFRGQNLAGQTALSLSRTNVQFANAGGYSVVVTNSFGSVTSAVAQLTVFTNLVLTQTNRAPTTNEIGKPTIPTDPTHFKVFTNRTLQSGVGLDPNKMTVVITHGWNGSSTDWPTVTAQNIGQRIGASTVNIVAWDWTAEAASPPGLGVIAARTRGQGKALGTDLVAALGANYAQRIHFIGHSLGTLVNGHAAEYVHTNGFSWSNTQMTLCDEAEVASELNSTGWQMATTLPQIIGQGISSLATLSGNFSTPQRYWDHPLPQQFAWADNY
jgi:pimeloyl-ACP methyl ester carboxylesterase